MVHLLLDSGVVRLEVVHPVSAGEHEGSQVGHLACQLQQVPGATVVGPEQQTA